MAQQTSPKGIAFLESHEGVVLKAYRCPAGRWTIGTGLTAASGVITPKAGMTITRGQASEFLAKALRRNYEPAVATALPGAKQHEFDGAVSFHFNTGAIGRASWVKAWTKRDWPKVRSGLLAWVKGGGKVLPGLQRRRAEEADVIQYNSWPADLKIASEPKKPTIAHAGIVISISADELEGVRDGFRTLGYDPGPLAGAVRLVAVTDFQRDHDLTVDGLIGRATLSTLQRELDARSKAKTGTGGVAASGVVVGGNEAVNPATSNLPVGNDVVTWAGIAIGVLALIFLTWLAWTYRDVIAARIGGRFPHLAAWLRSF